MASFNILIILFITLFLVRTATASFQTTLCSETPCGPQCDCPTIPGCIEACYGHYGYYGAVLSRPGYCDCIECSNVCELPTAAFEGDGTCGCRVCADCDAVSIHPGPSCGCVPCSSLHPCGARGTSIAASNQCTCQCNDLSTGANCELCPVTAQTCATRGDGTFAINNASACNCVLCTGPDSGTCQNGAPAWSLDGSTCGCKCDSITCAHGTKNGDCSCSCPAGTGWSGNLCQTCSLTCSGGQFLDSSTCTCNQCTNSCQNGGTATSFDGSTCGCTCSNTCANGGTRNTDCSCSCSNTCQNGGIRSASDCSCACPAGSGWSGPSCQICDKTCPAGQYLDSVDCSCNSCSSPTCANGISPTAPGGTNSVSTCACDCNTITCVHGTKNADCTCSCPAGSGWSGSVCETCSRSCPGGQYLDPAACTCNLCTSPTCANGISPTSPGGTSLVGTCACDCNTITCAHGGTKNADCSCTCPVGSGWSGNVCQTCSRSCPDGQYLDPTACTCNVCTSPTCANGISPTSPGGTSPVDTCGCNCNSISCVHGGTKNADCTCSCPAGTGWSGNVCETCSRTCTDEQVLDSASCTCNQCTNSCQNGGAATSLDGTTCGCTCANTCTNGGTRNADCSCSCSNTCQNGGIREASDCACSCPAGSGWSGNVCETCSRSCPLGQYLDPAACTCNTCTSPTCANGVSPTSPGGTSLVDTCRCDCNTIVCAHGTKNSDCSCACPAGWSGNLCQTCQLSQSACLSNQILNSTTCQCEQCPDIIGCTATGGTVEYISGSTCGCKCPTDHYWDQAIPACSTGCAVTPADCTITQVYNTNTCHCDDCQQCTNAGTITTTNNICGCSCPSPWSGARCETCPIDETACTPTQTWDQTQCRCTECQVAHCTTSGGTIAVTTSNECSCACPTELTWESESGCVCKRQCPVNEQPTEDCGGCEDSRCSKIEMCLRGGSFDYETCSCKCSGYWIGTRCQTCPIRCGDATSQGRVNESQCKCNCMNDQWYAFTGEFCGCYTTKSRLRIKYISKPIIDLFTHDPTTAGQDPLIIAELMQQIGADEKYNPVTSLLVITNMELVLDESESGAEPISILNINLAWSDCDRSLTQFVKRNELWSELWNGLSKNKIKVGGDEFDIDFEADDGDSSPTDLCDGYFGATTEECIEAGFVKDANVGTVIGASCFLPVLLIAGLI